MYRSWLIVIMHAALGVSVFADLLAGSAKPRATIPSPRFHLTARPWSSTGVTRGEILDVIEGVCRYTATLQDTEGAVVDPERGREFQYATPYFACAVGALLDAGRGSELRAAGIAAMEHSTASLVGGDETIPDRHGEFFVAALTTALELYARHVDETTLARWKSRMRTPIGTIMENQHGRTNNWRTYAMKGEWLRAKASLVSRELATTFVEDAWWRRTQRTRIAGDRWNLYQDWSSDPSSHTVEAVGRGNLLALVAAGYDGPSANEIASAVERGTRAALLWQSPSGECPPNGRTDDHVFGDVVMGLGFATMAARFARSDDMELAGQYRRAAALGFRAITPWRRKDGSFSVTKNQFSTEERVGYQPASATTNYNGALMYHLAELATTWETIGDVAERPSPAEIGGYVIEADPRFGSAVLDAGGMQVMLNLRGDTVPKYGIYWTPLGIVRFARTEWDGRLGPGDGALDARDHRGVTFGPMWRSRASGAWIRISEEAEHYRGTLEIDLVHPLLVRCRVTYHSVTGRGGPTFVQHITVVPDGVLIETECNDDTELAVSLPVLVNDGAALGVFHDNGVIGSRFADSGDSQNYLVLDADAEVDGNEDPIRGTYGWLRPVRVTSSEGPVRVFVYPRSAGEPHAVDMLNGFQITSNGFQASRFYIEGTAYVGRFAAGGVVDGVDLDRDGNNEVEFSETCAAIVLHRDGGVTDIEVDRPVTAKIDGKRFELQAYCPQTID